MWLNTAPWTWLPAFRLSKAWSASEAIQWGKSLTNPGEFPFLQKQVWKVNLPPVWIGSSNFSPAKELLHDATMMVSLRLLVLPYCRWCSRVPSWNYPGTRHREEDNKVVVLLLPPHCMEPQRLPCVTAWAELALQAPDLPGESPTLPCPQVTPSSAKSSQCHRQVPVLHNTPKT